VIILLKLLLLPSWFYNKIYINGLLEKGYVIADDHSKYIANSKGIKDVEYTQHLFLYCLKHDSQNYGILEVIKVQKGTIIPMENTLI